MQKAGDEPYWDEDIYQEALFSEPDILILMLGTNDAKEINWSDKETFVADYKEMANIFMDLPS